MRKVDFARVNHIGLAVSELDQAELAIFTQALIEQRLLRLDHLRFQQQRAEIAHGRDPDEAARPGAACAPLPACGSGTSPASADYAFPDIERQRLAVTVKGVDAGLIRQAFQPFAQMFGIFIDGSRIKLEAVRGGTSNQDRLL